MAPVASAPAEIEYPSSDGEPMAETPVHRDVMLDTIVMLKGHFEAEPDVYVSGNMMMYDVEGNPEKSVSPDVVVTRGIRKLPEREVYRIWLEGKGPDAVIEVTSRSTSRIDLRWKFELYRDVLQVQEYFLFDPREKTLAGASLAGYRLENGQYRFIVKTGGRLVSEVLGLHLEPSGEQLRLYDPRRGIYLPTPAEIHAALQRETAAYLAAGAEIEKLRQEIQAPRRSAAGDS